MYSVICFMYFYIFYVFLKIFRWNISIDRQFIPKTYKFNFLILILVSKFSLSIWCIPQEKLRLFARYLYTEVTFSLPLDYGCQYLVFVLVEFLSLIIHAFMPLCLYLVAICICAHVYTSCCIYGPFFLCQIFFNVFLQQLKYNKRNQSYLHALPKSFPVWTLVEYVTLNTHAFTSFLYSG